MTAIVLTATPAAAEAPPPFILEWGGAGSGNGEFAQPIDLCVDSEGDVYVADAGNGRIQRFTNAGVFVLSWPHAGGINAIDISPTDRVYAGGAGVTLYERDGTLVEEWTVVGDTGLIGVGQSGGVYVGDGYTIRSYSSSGGLTCSWNTNALWPIDCLMLDRHQQQVYTGSMQSGVSCVHKYPPCSSTFNRWCSNVGAPFGPVTNLTTAPAYSFFVITGATVQKCRWDCGNCNTAQLISEWGSEGSGPGQFQDPRAVAVDASGNVFVADTGNDRIQKFGEGGPVAHQSTSWGSIKAKHR
ncbi:hypothetical protein K8I85_01955 [bacterium]|nr:hypothetical protein [bacterium]